MTRYMFNKWPRICLTNDHVYVQITIPSFLYPRFITRFLTIVTRRLPLVEHELPTPSVEHELPTPSVEHELPTPSVEHELPTPSVEHELFNLKSVSCFMDHCLSFYPFSFCHCIFICLSSIYGWWLLLWISSNIS
jgi:hypothetical protein